MKGDTCQSISAAEQWIHSVFVCVCVWCVCVWCACVFVCVCVWCVCVIHTCSCVRSFSFCPGGRAGSCCSITWRSCPNTRRRSMAVLFPPQGRPVKSTQMDLDTVNAEQESSHWFISSQFMNNSISLHIGQGTC